MKLFIFTSLVVAIAAASDRDLWIQFKKDHSKTYKSLREEKFRFNIFQEKLREIESHNEKYENGEVSYFLRVNQFSDLTTEEFVDRLNKNIGTLPELNATTFKEELNTNFSAPFAINWVEKGAVLDVQNQGRCGSCWAFSSTGAIEGQNFIKNNERAALSVQQLVDCTPSNFGCSGGYMEIAFDYITENGIATESDYPYEGVDGYCHQVESAVEINGYVSVERNEAALQAAVGSVGPISVLVNADLWQSYGGGIFDNSKCERFYLNHAVLAVGYGEANGKSYWLIKNSWGETWGESGYLRLVRDKNDQCGISRQPSYPIL